MIQLIMILIILLLGFANSLLGIVLIVSILAVPIIGTLFETHEPDHVIETTEIQINANDPILYSNEAIGKQFVYNDLYLKKRC